MKVTRALALGAIALLGTNNAFAHHGRDFLLVQTAHLPEARSIFGISRQDYVSEETDETELEPAILFGALDWLAFEVHGHLEKLDSGSFNYESTAPAIHLRATPRSSPWAIGASFEYEIARESEGHDAFEAAAILGYEGERSQFAANVLFEDEIDSEEKEKWGYALGARFGIEEQQAVGLELLGSFEDGDGGELMLGYYFGSGARLTLNFGLGVGFDEGPDWALRSAVIWKFR